MELSSATTISYDSIKHILPVLPPIQHKLIVKPSTYTEALYEATQLLTFVSDKRASDKESWSSIGRLLFKLSNETRNGLDAWIEFSKRTMTFNEDDCSTYWSTIENPTESIHLIFVYIQQDKEHKESYLIYKNNNGKLRLMQSITLNGTELYEEDVAGVMYILYKDEFLYYNGGWYQYKKENWVQIKDAIELRSRIPKLSDFFEDSLKSNRKTLTEAENKFRDVEDNDIDLDVDENELDDENTEKRKEIKKNKLLEELQKEVTRQLAIREKILLIRKQLKKIAFKNGIMTECKDIFFDTVGILESCDAHEIYAPIVQEKNILCSTTPNCKIITKPCTIYNTLSNPIEEQHIKYTSTIQEPKNSISTNELAIIEKLNSIHWKPSTTYKRVNEIIIYCNFKKSSVTSQKVKEYFIKKTITIVEDNKHGHKVYIEY